MTNYINIKTLRGYIFNNGKENLTVAKRNGNTIWLRNQYGSMQTETISNLFNPLYYTHKQHDFILRR